MLIKNSSTNGLKPKDKSIREYLIELLKETVIITDADGNSKEYTNKELIFIKLSEKAKNGNKQAIKMLK